ncbi:MAG: ABC transporter ATP-binding protein [Dehalococcoidia bacterium]|nr:ABC transporter ATP-binding protein [Dehalococcoidia bacterium]
MIRLRGISKIYRAGDVAVPALLDVDLDIEDGEFLAIMGPSGSGKSTLMNILGCLDRPTRGTYELDGHFVHTMSDDHLARVRNRRIGFVFQSFNLLPRLPAIDQVELPLIYRGARNRRRLAIRALEAVGVADRMQHRPTQLSGGQQQRVAIARALVTNPTMIMADEPTGALDTKTSGDVMRTFDQLNRERNITIVFVTHEPEVAAYTRRIIHIRDGRITDDSPPGQTAPAATPRQAVDWAPLPPDTAPA